MAGIDGDVAVAKWRTTELLSHEAIRPGLPIQPSGEPLHFDDKPIVSMAFINRRAPENGNMAYRVSRRQGRPARPSCRRDVF
jgi:hypothetical protein